MNACRMLYPGAAALVLALSLGGCDRRTPTTTSGQTPRSTPPATQPSSPTGQPSSQTGVAQTDTDRRLTEDIRRALMDNSGLSTNARDFQIMASGGTVTLRGQVASQAEKDLVEQTVRGVSGVTSVNNQLDIRQ